MIRIKNTVYSHFIINSNITFFLFFLQDSRSSHYSLGNEQHKVSTVHQRFLFHNFAFYFFRMMNHQFCFSWNILLFNFYNYLGLFFLFFYEKFLTQLFFSVFFFFFGIFTLSLFFYSFFPFNLFLSFLQVKYMSVARESMNKVYQTDDGTYVLHYSFKRTPLFFFLKKFLVQNKK